MGLDRGNGAFQFLQNDRIAWRAMGGLVGELEDLGRRKTRGQSFEAPGGIFPIGVTTGSSEQVDLPFCAVQKSRTQFCNKGLIVPHCSRQSGI